MEPFIEENMHEPLKPERNISKQLFSSNNSLTLKKSYQEEKLPEKKKTHGIQ